MFDRMYSFPTAEAKRAYLSGRLNARIDFHRAMHLASRDARERRAAAEAARERFRKRDMLTEIILRNVLALAGAPPVLAWMAAAQNARDLSDPLKASP